MTNSDAASPADSGASCAVCSNVVCSAAPTANFDSFSEDGLAEAPSENEWADSAKGTADSEKTSADSFEDSNGAENNSDDSERGAACSPCAASAKALGASARAASANVAWAADAPEERRGASRKR